MALDYTYTRIKDKDTIEVGQKTTLKLYYIAAYSEELQTTKELKTGETVIVRTPYDGSYKVIMIAENEPIVTFTFYVRKHLQNSIIADVKRLLCKNCNCGCGEDEGLCISNEAKKCLKTRGIFVKLLSYQHFYLYTFDTDYTNIFNNIIKEGITNQVCNLQTSLNRFLTNECITSSTGDTSKVFKLFLALYWYAMYYIEFTDATTEEEKEFVTTKYKFTEINKCLCDLCLDLDELVTSVTPTPDNSLVYFWQFDNIDTDINFAPGVNQAYLDTVENITLTQALSGNTYNFTSLGRIALVVPATTENKYSIFDTFNQNITDVTFDTYYNSVLNIQIYISKEYYAPSNFYFKLIPN